MKPDKYLPTTTPQLNPVFCPPVLVAISTCVAVTLFASTAFTEDFSTHEPDHPPAMEAEKTSSRSITTAVDVIADERRDDPARSTLDGDETRKLTHLMTAGFEAEEQGHYGEAKQHFVEAYALFPHSNLLLSIARVAELSGDRDMALSGYERFVQRRPDYEKRDALHVRMETIRLEIQFAAEDDEEDDRAAEEMIAHSSSRLSPPSALGWGGIVTAATGLTSVIAGGIVASSVNSDFEGLDQLHARGEYGDYQHLAHSIDDKQSRGKVLFYGGMGLVAVGSAIAVYDVLQSPELSSAQESVTRKSRWTLAPLDSDGASLRWTRSF